MVVHQQVCHKESTDLGSFADVTVSPRSLSLQQALLIALDAAHNVQDSTGTHEQSYFTDAYYNGSSAWKLPNIEELPDSSIVTRGSVYSIQTYLIGHFVSLLGLSLNRGMAHILGGLEKTETGSISTDPENHDKMDRLRY